MWITRGIDRRLLRRRSFTYISFVSPSVHPSVLLVTTKPSFLSSFFLAPIPNMILFCLFFVTGSMTWKSLNYIRCYTFEQMLYSGLKKYVLPILEVQKIEKIEYCVLLAVK